MKSRPRTLFPANMSTPSPKRKLAHQTVLALAVAQAQALALAWTHGLLQKRCHLEGEGKEPEITARPGWGSSFSALAFLPRPRPHPLASLKLLHAAVAWTPASQAGAGGAVVTRSLLLLCAACAHGAPSRSRAGLAKARLV